MTEEPRSSYQRIKREVLDAIRDGTWPPGTILPGEVELASEFGCARATVSRAMRELAEEGVLDRKRKAGTRVRLAPPREAKFAIPLIRAEIEATGAAYRYACVSRREIAAPAWLVAHCGLEDGARVIHLVCMHYAGGAPYQHEERWISLDAVPAARETDFAQEGPNEWLVRQMPFTEIEHAFSAVAATPELAQFLDAPPEAALFRVERTTWLHGRNVTFARLTFRHGHKLRTSL